MRGDLGNNTPEGAELLAVKAHDVAPVTLLDHALRTHRSAQAMVFAGMFIPFAGLAWELRDPYMSFIEAFLVWLPMILLWGATFTASRLGQVVREPHPTMTVIMLPVLLVSAWFYASRGLAIGYSLPLTAMWIGVCAVGAGTTTPNWQAAVAANLVFALIPNYVFFKHGVSTGALIDLNAVLLPMLMLSASGAGFLHRAREQQIIAERRLAFLASIDPLTNIPNRRKFFAKAEAEIARCQRYNHRMTLLVFDIDDFKLVNDQYGHNVGDDVLVGVAKTCTSVLRGTDIFGRVGGEEFAAVLVETPLSAGEKVAERLRKAVSANVVNSYGNEVSVTLSMGVTDLAPNDTSLNRLIRRADMALLRAKDEGKDRVLTQTVTPMTAELAAVRAR